MQKEHALFKKHEIKLMLNVFYILKSLKIIIINHTNNFLTEDIHLMNHVKEDLLYTKVNKFFHFLHC